jgi:hypothetical protein
MKAIDISSDHNVKGQLLNSRDRSYKVLVSGTVEDAKELAFQEYLSNQQKATVVVVVSILNHTDVIKHEKTIRTIQH